eukprot:317795-Chlamydomonas_euryale.AAC.1
MRQKAPPLKATELGARPCTHKQRLDSIPKVSTGDKAPVSEEWCGMMWNGVEWCGQTSPSRCRTTTPRQQQAPGSDCSGTAMPAVHALATL